MTNEEKDILMKDLCARLPYGFKYQVQYGDTSVRDVKKFILDGEYSLFDTWMVHEIKPFLRLMSSMTEEELNECVCQSGIKDIECPNWQNIPKEKQFEARLNHAIAVFLTDSNNVDWLNAHHFDYRGLIERGLALEAPEGMYNI